MPELGARGSKRYIECLTTPPSAEDIARKVLTWFEHEFPSVDADVATEGLRLAADRLAQVSESDD